MLQPPTKATLMNGFASIVVRVLQVVLQGLPLEEHLAKMEGNIAPCQGVLEAIADKIFKRIQDYPRWKRSHMEVEEIVSLHAS